MTYRVVVLPRAQREIDGLPDDIRRRVLRALSGLERAPRPHGAKMLHGSPVGWRIRVGDYRVLYLIDDSTRSVTIGSVGHRREVYR